MALGIVNTMVPIMYQYLRYLWNEVIFSSARITQRAVSKVEVVWVSPYIHGSCHLQYDVISLGEEGIPNRKYMSTTKKRKIPKYAEVLVMTKFVVFCACAFQIIEASRERLAG